MPPQVLITETLDPKPAEWLATQARVVWCPHDKPDELARRLADAEGLVVRTYTQVNDGLLDLAPKLKVVGRAGVGLENIDLAACRRRGVKVVYTPDANTQAVVEYMLALMLDAVRPRYALYRPVEPEEFHRLRRKEVGVQLDELTLGILGFGRIGKRLGRVAATLGMRVLVNDLIPEPDLRAAVAAAPGSVSGPYPFEFVDKPTLYRESDILTVHVDGRAENKRLLNAETFAQLKPACLFINAARGMLIDNAALAAWARKVELKGGKAILDVHDPEPMPPDYPLYGLDNVRLLPHLASRTHPAMENMSWVVRDVVAVLQGREPQYPA